MTSILTSPPGTFPLNQLREEAATSQGRKRLLRLIGDYEQGRHLLPAHERRTRDIAFIRVRYALQEAYTPAPLRPTPATGAAA